MDDFIENIKDFFRNNKIAAIVASILSLLSLIALIIVAIQTSPEKKSSSVKSKNDLKLSSEVLPPEESEILKEYYPYRKSHSKWELGEAEKFLTLPENDSIKEIETANDRIVSEIIDAAP